MPGPTGDSARGVPLEGVRSAVGRHFNRGLPGKPAPVPAVRWGGGGRLELRDRDSFRAWLVRMTWRLALDHRRAQGRRTARELTQVDAGTPHTATDLVAAHERASCLWAAIDALPERLRLVVVLAAIEEHDLAHVAQVLGLPVGTVK